MYVVFEAKGFQWVCDIGSRIKIPLLDKDVGEEVIFDKVLLVKNEDILIGRPYLEGAIVKGVITGHSRYGKIIVFKYKRRKRYRRTIGHRQHYSEIEIKDVILQKPGKEKKVKEKEMVSETKKEIKVKKEAKEKKPKKVAKKREEKVKKQIKAKKAVEVKKESKAKSKTGVKKETKPKKESKSKKVREVKKSSKVKKGTSVKRVRKTKKEKGG